jgi:phage gp45-like
MALYILVNYYCNKGYDLMRVVEHNGIKYIFEENTGETRIYHGDGQYIHLYINGHMINYVKYDLI